MDLIAPAKPREIWTPPRAEVRLHNHFLAELRDARTGKLVRTAEAENVFTNLGKQDIASGGALLAGLLFNNCGVGSGTGAPAVTDAALGIERAAANIATSAQVGSYQQSLADEANQVWWARRKYMFSETVANYALSEVGLGYGGGLNLSGGGSRDYPYYSEHFQTHTRALFKDANGNPISITKTGSQILTITATVYLTRGAVDQNMALLDKFFSQMVATNPGSYYRWRLGNGTLAPANTDTNLAGAEVAKKATNTVKNGLFWDDVASAWTTARPANKPYVTSIYCDWDLNEANTTFSEVLIHGPLPSVGTEGDATNVGIRLVFPCGTVAGTSYTKTNQVKLRQYAELVWG